MKYIDVNGDSIKVAGSMEFKLQYIKDVRVLLKDPVLRQVFESVSSNKETVYVSEVKAEKSIFGDDDVDKQNYDRMKRTGVSHTGKGLELEYAQLNGVKMQDVEATNSAVTLSHELTHVKDIFAGEEGRDLKEARRLKVDNREKFVNQRMERRAIINENRIRKILNMPERKTYLGEKLIK